MVIGPGNHDHVGKGSVYDRYPFHEVPNLQMIRNPEGETLTPLPPLDRAAEGIAMVEAFRGDVLVWVRFAHGKIARCHARDASWFQWPLLEAAIENNIVADFPLCNKSFNCSYSGHDL